MINKKIASTICLGIFVFGFIVEFQSNEQMRYQHEPVKTQISFFYSLNQISASGTVSPSMGSSDFTEV